MKLLRKFPLAIMIVIIISIMGSMMVHFSTFWGPWVLSDSTGYIFCARNLLAGNGLGLFGPSGAFHPLDLQPPFYSLVLSFFGLFGADLVIAARWIDVTLFGLTILLVGVSLYTFTKSSWLSVICSFLLFCMPVMVDIYSGAMSEPLFIFTGLAGIFLILLFLRNNRYIVLVAAALSSGLSMLTRYAGLAFIITGIIGLLVFSRRSWKNKIGSAFIYGVVSSLPSIGWLIWLRVQSSNPRSLYINANIWEQFTKFRLDVMEIFWSWLPFTSLLPRYTYNLAKNLLIIFVFLMLVLSCLAVWKVRKNSLRVSNSYSGLTFAGLMTVFTAAYMLILGFSYIFSDPPTSVYRILLPVQIVVVIGFFSLLLFFVRAWSSVKWLNLIPIFLSIGISISYLHDSIKIVSQYHQNGGGYTSQYARSSPTIHEVEQIPLNIPLISNESALVLFYTGRPAYDISELLDREPQVITNRYGDDPNDPAQKAFRENGGALVLFKSSIWQFEQLYGKQATSRLEYFVRDLSLYKQAYDGAIYFYPSTGLP
jgi:hypothetical protein